MPPDDGRDYPVGYGKPPRHTRFVKGQSGNPRGHPPGAKNIKTLLTQALDEVRRRHRPGRAPQAQQARGDRHDAAAYAWVNCMYTHDRLLEYKKPANSALHPMCWSARGRRD
jgi:hypothetical protein